MPTRQYKAAIVELAAICLGSRSRIEAMTSNPALSRTVALRSIFTKYAQTAQPRPYTQNCRAANHSSTVMSGNQAIRAVDARSFDVGELPMAAGQQAHAVFEGRAVQRGIGNQRKAEVMLFAADGCMGIDRQ